MADHALRSGSRVSARNDFVPGPRHAIAAVPRRETQQRLPENQGPPALVLDAYDESWTDSAPDEVRCFLEVKSKIGSLRTKTRAALSMPRRLLLENPFLQDEIVELPRRSGMDNLDLPAALLPMLFIQYQRARFVDSVTGCRIALDTRIRAVSAHPHYVPARFPVSLSVGVLEVKGAEREFPESLGPLGGYVTKAAFSKIRHMLGADSATSRRADVNHERFVRVDRPAGRDPSVSVDMTSFIFALCISVVAGIVVSLLYQRFYSQRATGSQVHRAFLLMSPSITALFIAIQFSLPLSLGLLARRPSSGSARPSRNRRRLASSSC